VLVLTEAIPTNALRLVRWSIKRIFSSRNEFDTDSLPDDAVWIEQVSTGNSLLTRTITGNFSDLGLPRYVLRQANPVFPGLFSQIPYSTERGIVISSKAWHPRSVCGKLFLAALLFDRVILCRRRSK